MKLPDWFDNPFGNRTCGETLVSALVVLVIISIFTTVLIPNHILPHPAEWIPEENYEAVWSVLAVVIAMVISFPLVFCIAWDIRRHS